MAKGGRDSAPWLATVSGVLLRLALAAGALVLLTPGTALAEGTPTPAPSPTTEPTASPSATPSVSASAAPTATPAAAPASAPTAALWGGGAVAPPASPVAAVPTPTPPPADVVALRYLPSLVLPLAQTEELVGARAPTLFAMTRIGGTPLSPGSVVERGELVRVELFGLTRGGRVSASDGCGPERDLGSTSASTLTLVIEVPRSCPAGPYVLDVSAADVRARVALDIAQVREATVSVLPVGSSSDDHATASPSLAVGLVTVGVGALLHRRRSDVRRSRSSQVESGSRSREGARAS